MKLTSVGVDFCVVIFGYGLYCVYLFVKVMVDRLEYWILYLFAVKLK